MFARRRKAQLDLFRFCWRWEAELVLSQKIICWWIPNRARLIGGCVLSEKRQERIRRVQVGGLLSLWVDLKKILSLNLQEKFRAGRKKNKSNQRDKGAKKLEVLRKTCKIATTSAKPFSFEKQFGTFSSSSMLLLAEVSVKGLKVHAGPIHTHSSLIVEIGNVFIHLSTWSHVVQTRRALNEGEID